MEDLIEKVLIWANDRNLIEGSDPKTQMLKCISECGELADNINKQNDIRDDIGDVLVPLIIIAAQHGLCLKECLDKAYNEIKNRKGIMLDGVFIKTDDPNYDNAVAIVMARQLFETGA